MPFDNEPYVELACVQHIVGNVPPIAYNALLLLSCCYLAFQTRKTPDNFNECLHIFLIAVVTVFVWVAYMPTFFLLLRSVDQVILTNLSAVLDCTIVLLALFAPKLYAVYYLEETEKLIYLRDPDTGYVYTARKSASVLHKDVVEVPLTASRRSRSGSQALGIPSMERKLTLPNDSTPISF